jgi:hypothetical protein
MLTAEIREHPNFYSLYSTKRVEDILAEEITVRDRHPALENHVEISGRE